MGDRKDTRSGRIVSLGRVTGETNPAIDALATRSRATLP